jgi:hypothetical protein
MEIAIEQLSLHLGQNFSPTRARGIGEQAGAALQEMLRAQRGDFAAATAGYRVSSLAVPSIRVRSGASDDEIAHAVADALARAISRELEI